MVCNWLGCCYNRLTPPCCRCRRLLGLPEALRDVVHGDGGLEAEDRDDEVLGEEQAGHKHPPACPVGGEDGLDDSAVHHVVGRQGAHRQGQGR